MKSKITLQPPYSKDYKSGYLNTNKEPRRVVALVKNNGDRTSTSYARYLMSCKLGRYLKDNEHVDHIDDDKMNDVLDNYQILTPSENNSKNRSRTYKTLECPVCKNTFSREVRQINYKIKQGKIPTCSRRCGGIMSHTKSFPTGSTQ